MNYELSREKLLKTISIHAFAVYEALLYLDMYPNSKSALEYYNRNKRLEMKARYEYESKYGPLTAPIEAGEWKWTDGPWPWQLEKEAGC